MADFNDPFAVPTTYRISSEDVVSPAQRSLARQRLTADPVSDAITKTSQRKSDLGRSLESMKLTRDQFLDTEGSGLFVSDPMTKKRMTNPDGSFVPQMGSQIEALRQRAQTRVGTIRGALTPAVAGDLTDDAKAAAAELSAIEPTYKAQMQKYERIQEQMRRVQQAHDETEIELGQLSMARVARTNPQMADDIFTLPPASIPAPAPEVNQPPARPNTAAPEIASEGPTFLGEVGKNAKDLGASFGVGANSLMKMVGDLYGLATGDMDNAVSRAGQYGVDYFNEMKSPEIRAAEAARKQKIDAADGEIGKALAYIRETVTNPMLLGSAVTEQLPNTVGTGGAGALVRAGAEKMLLKTLAAEAAKRLATKVGVGTAIATGAAMQGADVGANQYDELVTSLTEMPAAQAAQIPEIAEAMERGATLDEAKLALALTQARKTGAVAGGISLAAQALPGARTIERTIVGGGAGRSARGRIASAVAGAVGEGVSEVIEEGGGQITKNVQARPVDPTREATAGLGETAGQALVTAAAMGGGAGALNGTGGAPDTTLGRANGGAQVPPAPTATPATGEVVGGTEDRAEAPSGPKPFDQQYRVSFTDAQGQPAAQYFDVESDQQAIKEFQQANPGIQTFDVRSPITPPTPVYAELQAELDAQTQAEAAPEPAPTPSAQPVQLPDVSVETVLGTAAEQPAVPAPLPATQGPDSGAGSAPDEVAGVETAPAPAPTAQLIDAGDSDDLGSQAAQPASMPESVATPDVGQTTAPQNADVGAASPAPTSSEALEGEKINKKWTGFAPESQSLNIPRAEMPQIKSEARGALTQFLKARGVDHTAEEVSPSSLKPTQAEFSPGLIKKAIARREEEGGQGRAIIVSSDNHIVDGHHQWMAALESAPNEPFKVIRLNAPIRDLLTQIKEFPSAENAKGATTAASSPSAKPKAGTQAIETPAVANVQTEPPSQPPASASDSAQAPAPSPTPEPGPAARADFKLPRDLAGAKPRYNYRDKEFSLNFESELDKALFILAQKSPSKRDADFAREVTRQTGLSDADARKAGSLVREEIKSMAKEQGESGGLTVPVIHRASDFAPTPAPVPAAAPAPKPISPQPTATATGPNSSLKKPQPPAAVAGGEKPFDATKAKGRKVGEYPSPHYEFQLPDGTKKSIFVARGEGAAEARIKLAKEMSGGPSAEGVTPRPGETAPAGAALTAQQGPGKTETAPSARKGKRIGVGATPDGQGDILNAIEELGGIRSPETVSRPGGEYDGFKETFQNGLARLLIRKGGTGSTPDQLIEELRESGFNFNTPDAMYAAIARAIEDRKTNRKKFNADEYGDRFEKAFLGNEQSREYWRSEKRITVDDLSVGDKFEVNGEKFEVKDIDEDGNVTVKDGVTRTVPPGTPVYPDKGVVSAKKKRPEFISKKETQGDLIPADEIPFNLDGGAQADGARLLAERINREEGKRSADAAQTKIPEAEATPKKSLFDLQQSTPTGETVDPAAPRGLSFVESSADALPAKTREDLANFEATLNRGQSAGAERVSLRVRELGTESADATRGESGNTAAAARLRRGLEEAFGKKIIFVEPTGNQRWAAITARQAPKTVLVNTKAAAPFMALTGHEFTHNLQAERPDLYQRLGNFLDEFAPMPDSYSTEKTAQGYKEDKVRDEWIADVVGQRFDEPQFWKEAAAVAERRGAGDAFKQLARDAFEYLTKLGRRITMALSRRGTAPFLEEIDRIRSTIAKVLVDYSAGENVPAGAELMQMAASTPTTTAASEAVRAKYPDRFNDIPENHLPVEVKTASGEIIPATMYGYWDMRIIDGPISVGIGYFTEDGGITHSGIREGDTLLTEVPPPADFGIQASTPESPETNLSQSPRTERAAGLSVDDIEYNVRGHKDVEAEAKEFIGKNGETKAARVALDPADRSMPADTRTFVIGELMKRRVEKMKDAKTSPEEQESLARELQNLSASYNPQLRESAQQLSARQSLLSDARAGSIDQYVRDVQDEQDRAITPAGKKVIEEAKDELTKVDAPAIDKVAKAVAPKIDEIPLTKSLWKQYRDDAAARVSDWVDGKTTPREEEAPLKVFTDRILAEIRARLPKSKAEPVEAEQPASALLREAIENKEKYADVLKSVRDQVAEQYGENSRQMERVDMLLGDLGLKPYSKRLLDKAVKQAHDAMKTNVREIARMHYTQANRLHQDLAAALVDEAGLSKDRAKELAQDIEKRMRELTGEAKIKALAALKKRADATPRTRRIIDSITKSTELNNLGALSVSSLSDMVAKELKLPRASVETMRSLSQIADRIETAKNQSERSRAELDMARALRVARGITKTDVATSIWYANMLSGYTTQMANTLGNVMNGTLQLASVMATNPKHGAEALRGWIDGFGEGWAQGKAIIKSGRGSREFDARTGEAGNVLELVDYKRDFPDLNEKIASGLQTHAKLMRYVTRGMKAVDSIFYYPAREAYARVVTAKLLEGQYEGKELYQKTRELLGVAPDQLVAAKKQAEAEGFTGIDLSLRTANIIEEKRRTTAQGAQASDASERFALDTTFNNEPEGWAGVLYQGLVPLTESVRPGGVPILKTFLPFLRVPTNVFNASMNFTPQGAVRALRGMPLGVTRGKDGKYHVERREFTKDERNRLLAQSIGGSLTMAGLTALALGAGNDEGEEPWFDITATGPDDFRKRQQLEATGWRPHSVKFGDTWVSYKDSPLLLPLSISGHVVDAVRYKKQADELTLGNKVTDAVMTAPRAIFETSMLSGLGTMMDFASGNASAKQVEGFLARTVMTAAIPNLATQIDRTFNPETREANGPLGAIGAAVPFVRNTGDVKTDVLGEPVERGPMRRFGSIEENDPLREVLRDKKVFISTPSRDTKLGNGPMDEDQYREFVRTSGERINQRLRPFTATLRRMTPEQAERAVDKVVRDERERAKNVIRARVPAGR